MHFTCVHVSSLSSNTWTDHTSPAFLPAVTAPAPAGPPGQCPAPPLRPWHGTPSPGAPARPYLHSLRGTGPQLPADDLLEHVGKEADSDEQDDDQPGRPAGQQLDEHVVHPLITEERPREAADGLVGGQPEDTVPRRSPPAPSPTRAGVYAPHDSGTVGCSTSHQAGL